MHEEGEGVSGDRGGPAYRWGVQVLSAEAPLTGSEWVAHKEKSLLPTGSSWR